MLAERPIGVDAAALDTAAQAAAEAAALATDTAEAPTPGRLAEACRHLDWLIAGTQRRAQQAYAAAAAYSAVLVAALGSLSLLHLPFNHAPGWLWLVAAGLSAAVSTTLLVGQFALLRRRPPLLDRQLELAQLAARIEAGLLDEHARLAEFYRHYPGQRARAVSSPELKLGYLMQGLELYLGSAPVTAMPPPWVYALLIVGSIALCAFMLPALVFTGHPVLLFYLVWIPFGIARRFIEPAARARVLAEYLRAAANAGPPAEPLTLAVLERRCQFALDVNQLEIDLQKTLPTFGMPPRQLHWWTAAVLALATLATQLLLPHALPCGLVGAALVATTVLTGQWFYRAGLRYRPHIRQWLESSGVLIEIALEELTTERLVERVAPAWRSLLRNQGAVRWPQYRGGLKQTLWTVAFNASWLEGGLKLSRHAGFLIMVLFLPGIFLGLAAGVPLAIWLSEHMGWPAWNAGAALVAVFCAVLLPAILPMQVQLQRRIIAAEEFIALLQRRLLE